MHTHSDDHLFAETTSRSQQQASRGCSPFSRCWLLVLCGLVCLPAPIRAAERNIIFLITDDQSCTLRCYGDPVAISPHADALAADGVLFENAFATVASCSPSRSVILSGWHQHATGQYGLEHGVHHFSSLKKVEQVTLPRVLANAGYRTGHIGKLHVAPEEAYHFETYLKGNPRRTVELVEACREFITQPDEKPFFLYIGATDPHRSGDTLNSSPLKLKPNLFGNPAVQDSAEEAPFDPATVPVPEFLTDTPECRAELAQYYQSCARIDRGLGRLIEILKQNDLYEKTLIVFTSDHGMPMPGAKTTVYDPGLRVPFIVRDPYQKHRGVVSQAMISLVDVTPSLLDFAGAFTPPAKGGKAVASRDNYHGHSWLPILEQTNPPGWDTVYASHNFHEVQMYYPMRAIRDRDYKFIWNLASELPFPFAADLYESATWQAQLQQGLDAACGKKTRRQFVQRPRFELYDLRNDPLELHNLADQPAQAERVGQFQQRLQAFQKQTADPWSSKWTYE